ncbi:hypothetical protein STEG23_019937 [Scotinomys teguina]
MKSKPSKINGADLDAVALSFNPSTLEAEAGRLLEFEASQSSTGTERKEPPNRGSPVACHQTFGPASREVSNADVPMKPLKKSLMLRKATLTLSAGQKSLMFEKRPL